MSRTSVSVVIVTYNRAESLKISLEFLTHQTLKPLEIVVVDNASKDHTKQVVESFQEKLPVRYVYESIQGVAPARTRGFKESKGDLIFYTDDDCRPNKDWIEKMVKRFELDPEIGVVGGLILPERPDPFTVIGRFSYDTFTHIDPTTVE